MGKGDAALADALLYSGSTAQYLLGRLVDVDERWESITNPVLMRLGRRYTAQVVITALGFMREEARDDTRTPVALLTAVCKRIAGQA